MYDNNFHIIHPRSDTSRIMVKEIHESDVGDYMLASRRSFSDFEDAEEYAQELARKHGKTYLSPDGNAYLD